MVLESLPVLSTAYLMILAGAVLLIVAYRSDGLSRHFLVSGVFLFLMGLGLIGYFLLSFG